MPVLVKDGVFASKCTCNVLLLSGWMVVWVLVISVLTVTPLTARDVSMNGIFLSKKLHRFAEDIIGLPRMQV